MIGLGVAFVVIVVATIGAALLWMAAVKEERRGHEVRNKVPQFEYTKGRFTAVKGKARRRKKRGKRA